MKETSRPKSKKGTPTASRNNNFSEKYFQYTRERKFYTPKKPSNLKSESKESLRPKQELFEKISANPSALANFQKTPKISINMEIKNLNFFGNPTAANPNPDSKKKKLHKKTISALGKHQN